MLTPRPIIKHPHGPVSDLATGSDALGEDDTPDVSHFLGGVIRDKVAQRYAQPAALDEADWSSDLPPLQHPASPSLLSAEECDALRATWQAEWQQEADAEREAAVAAAREAAYADGFAAAQTELAAEREAERAAFADDAARLHALWQSHLAAIDPLLVDFAVNVAEAVLNRPLDDDGRDAATAALTAALERLADQPPLVVALHPVDQLRLQEAGMIDALTATHPGLRWVPDAALAVGDWSLDAAGAAVRHVRAEVLSDLRRRLGLDPAPDAADAADAA